jgi:CBS domain-containing protein
MQAKELMTTPAYTCGIDDAASVAAQIMWDHDCGVVPVVDADGHIVGVVTDRDLCMAAYFQGAPLSNIHVATAMAHDVCTCGPDDEIHDVERCMAEHQVRRVPVVDPARVPIGMLSVSDVALGLHRAGNGSIKPHQELIATVAAICQPRAAITNGIA